MNYMFQLGGLMDADGRAHLGFSEGRFHDLTERA